MVTRGRLALAGAVIVTAVAATAVAATGAGTATRATTADAAGERPRGVVESCSRISGIGAGLRDFTRPRNLVVGPLAVLRAGGILGYAPTVGGNKLFVLVKGGHRVTLELSPETRRGAGLAFGLADDHGEAVLGATRRVVTFKACKRGENTDRHLDGWPVSAWVGFLLADSARCVPLRVWVDDEPTPRPAVIRFGVRMCELTEPHKTSGYGAR